MSLLYLPGWQTVEVIDKPKAYRITATCNDEPSVCPKDGHPLYRHGTLQKLFRDLPIHGKRVSILAIRQRYRCRACRKTFQQPVTGIHERRKMTERLVLHIQEEAKHRPFAAVAHEVGVDEKTVRAIFDEHATAALQHLRPASPRVLGIDEVHLRRRSRCVFTNIEEATILDILPSWSYHSVYQFLFTHLKDRSAVEIVCLDMHHPYRLAVKATLPEAVLVVDKWHVLRIAYQAVDAVRLALRSKMSDRKRRGLMRSRRLLRERHTSLNEFDRMNLEAWLNEWPPLKEAYWLKEEFCEVYEAPNRRKAMERFDAWSARLPNSAKPFFQPLLTAMGNWREEIFAYFNHRYTNATAEALNGLIKAANRTGRGYSFRTLRAKMLLSKGVQKTRQAPVPNYGWARDLMGVMPVRIQELGADISTISRLFQEGATSPISTNQSG